MKTKSRLEGIDRVTVITGTQTLNFASHVVGADRWRNHVKGEWLTDEEFEKLLDGYRAAGCVVIPEADEENTYGNGYGYRTSGHAPYGIKDEDDGFPILAWKSPRSIKEWGYTLGEVRCTLNLSIPDDCRRIVVHTDSVKTLEFNYDCFGIWKPDQKELGTYTTEFLEREILPQILDRCKCIATFTNKNSVVIKKFISAGGFNK